MSKVKASQKISGSVRKKTTRRPVILVSIAAMVLVVSGVLLSSVFSVEGKPNAVITPDNVQDMIAELDEKERVPIGSYEVNMNNCWTFPDSHSASTDAYIGNSINNQSTVYFTIALKGSEEDFYTSPYLPIGSKMENVTLDCELAAGTYDTVLTYHLVDGEYQEISHVSVGLEIIIEK